MQVTENTFSTDDKHNKKEPSTEAKITEIEPQMQIQVDQQKQYHQQGYRWVIVALVSVAFTINNLTNNTIIPIASKIAEVYGLSQTYANLPIQISFLVNPIMNFTAGHFMDSKGLGISFRIGSVFYVVGMIGYCLINFGYHWVLIGSILISLGQPLVMNCPAKVATFWFISKNRTLATGIISAINFITLGVSLVFPTLFVDEDSQGDQAKTQIFNLYTRYFFAAIANSILIMFLMREKPEKLPSAGAQRQKTSFRQTLEIIKEDRNIWRFLIASILLYGTFLSFGSTSNMLFKPYGFQNTQIAIFGICLLVSGVTGSVAYTFYIKKTHKYRNAIIFACVLAVAFVTTTALLMNLATQQRILISSMIVGMGFNLIPMVPISYDLGCQLTFPVGQAQIVGILTGCSMVYTAILTITITSVVGFGTPKQSAICMIIYITLFLIGAILFCSVQIMLKRRDHQAMKANQKTPAQNQNDKTISDSAKEQGMILPLNYKKTSDSQQIFIVSEMIKKIPVLAEEKSQALNEIQQSGLPPQNLATSSQIFMTNFSGPKLLRINPSQKNMIKDNQ